MKSLSTQNRPFLPVRRGIIKEQKGGRPILVIYADVLIGINLCLTWFLLLASEALSGMHCGRVRRLLAAAAGGISSLCILLPELPFPVVFLGKVGLALLICWIAGGKRGIFRRSVYFFGTNFLFAGLMIALWLLAAPPRLVIRNGMVYYHFPALTLGISAILGYLTARLIVWLRGKSSAGTKSIRVTAGLDGRESSFTMMLDTGNRLQSPGGLPVVVCGKEAISPMLSQTQLDSLSHPFEPACCWKKPLRFLPCRTVHGDGLLCAFEPDYLRAEDGTPVRCLIALSREEIRGDYQAVAGEDIFRQII